MVLFRMQDPAHRDLFDTFDDDVWLSDNDVNAAVHVFLHGHCHSLAVAMSEILLQRGVSHKFILCVSRGIPQHVGILLEGKILDIKGQWEVSSWCEFFGGDPVVVEPDKLDVRDFLPIQKEDARSWAEKVLARISQ